MFCFWTGARSLDFFCSLQQLAQHSPYYHKQMSGNMVVDKAKAELQNILSSSSCRELLLDQVDEACKKQLSDYNGTDAFLKGMITGGMEAISAFVEGRDNAGLVVPKAAIFGDIEPSASLASSPPSSPEKTMNPAEFVKYVVNEAAERAKSDPKLWKKFYISLDLCGTNYVFKGKTMTKKAMLTKCDSLEWEKGRALTDADIDGMVSFGGVSEMVSHPLVKSSLIRLGFGLDTDLGRLRDFFHAKHEPLAGLGKEKVPEADVKLVERSPSAADTFFDSERVSVDKGYAVVVSGESGSGKSVYSCLKARQKDFITIYTSLRPHDAKDPPESKQEESPVAAADQGNNAGAEPGDWSKVAALTRLVTLLQKKPERAFKELNEFLRLIIVLSEKTSAEQTEITSAEQTDRQLLLYHIKDHLNTSRNQWAQAVLRKAVGEAAGTKYSIWLNGKWPVSKRPKRVAIVVDEATDLDLAEGLVASVRQVMCDYLQTIARERVLVVVTGSGLDQLSKYKRVGTNPSYSRLVVMKAPNVERLKTEYPKEVYKALTEGLFANTLRTNARILCRSLLPILSDPFHQVDGYKGEVHRDKRQRRLEQRLVEVGSTRCLMDHGPRFYVNQNTVGELDGNVRDNLLRQAFLFHLEAAVRNARDRNSRAVAQEEHDSLVKMDTFKSIEDDEDCSIFSVGLVSRPGTSAALKYMACFGLTCDVRPGFGDEFEELTALHFLRYMQVQNFETERITLKHGWPPKYSGKGSPDDASLTQLREALSLQAQDEVFNLEYKEGTPICFVFSQGTATAQGGDVLTLTVGENGSCTLVPIQCKHYKVSPGPADVAKWWSSLGVEYENGKDKANWNPKNGSAGYSLAGLEGFRDLLTRKLGGKAVTIGDRILAVSFTMPSEVTNFPIPPHSDDHGKARVWFREMFEPTISTLKLVPPFDPTAEPSPGV